MYVYIVLASVRKVNPVLQVFLAKFKCNTYNQMVGNPETMCTYRHIFQFHRGVAQCFVYSVSPSQTEYGLVESNTPPSLWKLVDRSVGNRNQ